MLDVIRTQSSVADQLAEVREVTQACGFNPLDF